MQRIALTILTFSLLICPSISGRTMVLVPSVDKTTDSLVFPEMRSRMDKIRKNRPTVALVLAGGGALGAVHAGVLTYIDELGIPVDLVVGTSMGGLIGGIYSLGYSGKQIDSLLRNVDWGLIMSDNVPSYLYSGGKRKRVEQFCLDIPFHYDEQTWSQRQSLGSDKTVREQSFLSGIAEGYLYGFNVLNLLNSKSVGYQSEMSFLDLPGAFVCTSTDLASGREKNLAGGHIVDAIRSTISIPLAFLPVRKDDKVLVDGGLCNNFPADIARAMGADIVIGVDISLPTNLEDASSAVELVYMSATKPGSALSYKNNVGNVDIYLAPDISGYNLLSFNDKAISDLIGRGFSAAQAQSGAFEGLARLTGRDGRKLNGCRASDISRKDVRICSIEAEGLDDDELDYFLPKLGLENGSCYGAEDFEKAVSRVFGTGVFSRVTYRLIGEEEPYRFVMICDKEPVNGAQLGLRLDSESLVSVSMGIGFGINKLWGNKLQLSGELGKRSSLRADWQFVPKKAPSVNAYIETSFTTYNGLGLSGDDSERYINQFWHNELGLFANDNAIDNADIDLGIRIENTPIRKIYGGNTTATDASWKSVWGYVFLGASYYTLDDRYFPASGWTVSLRNDYLIGGYDAAGGSKTSGADYLSFNILVPVSFSDRIAVIPYLHSRLVFNNDGHSSNYMENVIGGSMAGRYFDHQMMFIGYNGVRSVGDMLAMAGMDLRFKLRPKLYVSLIGQAYNDRIDHGKLFERSVYAAAVQGSYNTMLGPIKADIHWDSFTKKMGLRISAGFDF